MKEKRIKQQQKKIDEYEGDDFDYYYYYNVDDDVGDLNQIESNQNVNEE